MVIVLLRKFAFTTEIGGRSPPAAPSPAATPLVCDYIPRYMAEVYPLDVVLNFEACGGRPDQYDKEALLVTSLTHKVHCTEQVGYRILFHFTYIGRAICLATELYETNPRRTKRDMRLIISVK